MKQEYDLKAAVAAAEYEGMIGARQPRPQEPLDESMVIKVTPRRLQPGEIHVLEKPKLP